MDGRNMAPNSLSSNPVTEGLACPLGIPPATRVLVWLYKVIPETTMAGRHGNFLNLDFLHRTRIVAVTDRQNSATRGAHGVPAP